MTLVQTRKEEVKQNMMALEDYSNPHSPSEHSNISSDTWEALENAEKLVQEARKKIVESSYNVPWLDLTLNGNFSSELDESDLKIRQLVISKLQQVNKRKLLEKQILSNRKEKDFSTESLRDRNKTSARKTEKRKTYQSPVKVVETCRKCSVEKMGNKLEEKYKLKAFNQVNDEKVKTKTSKETINNSKTNLKTQLSVRNVGKLDLMPISCNNSSRKTDKTFAFKHEPCKEKKNDENLIDVAIQTSFKELPRKEPAFLEQENLAAAGCQKNSKEIIECYEIQQQSIQENFTSPKKLEEKNKECQMVIDDNNKINTNNNNNEILNGESKGSFIKFLCQMTQEFGERVQMLPNPSKNSDTLQKSDISDYKSWDEEYYDELDAEEVNLDAPNLTNFDKMLCRLDRNIKNMIKDTDKLENLFSEAKSYNKIDKTEVKMNDQELDQRSIILHGRSDCTDKSPKKIINFRKNREIETSDQSVENDVSDGIKFTLKPRSRISSYESVSSEIFNQQARFSTPLNNYRNYQVPLDKQNTGAYSNEKYFIPESNVDINSDVKNDIKSDLNVFITRNQFSFTSGGKSTKEIERKIVDDKKEKNCDLKLVSVEKFEEKSNLSSHLLKNGETKTKSDFETDDKDTKEFQSSTSSVKNYSLHIVTDDINCNRNSNHNNINDNSNNNNNKINEIVEKNLKEQSEKSSIDDKIKKDHLLNDNVEIYSTPASSKDNIRDRTSFDISGIYSESFEESISELKRSINKNEDLQWEKKTRDEKEEENKSIIHNGKSQEKLFDELKTKAAVLEDDKIIKSISSQINIKDKKFSNESLQNVESENDGKSFRVNDNYTKEKSSLSIVISNSLSQKSTINSLLNGASSKIHSKKGSIHSEDYSEGEIRLPSSCSYSIGEIRIPASKLEKLKGKSKDVHFSRHVTTTSNSPVESIGEVLETDVESTSSFELRGQVS